MEQETRKYEISFLVREESEASPVAQVLAKQGAEILKQNQPARVRLAYPVEKEGFAFLVQTVFTAPATAVKSIQDELKTKNLVLRCLITLYEEPEEKRPVETAAPAAEEEAAKPEVAEDKPKEQKAEKRPTQEFQELSNEALEEKLKQILEE